jgi:hypothetical protein
MNLDVSVPCQSCQNPVRMGDQHCSGCGRAVTDDDRRVLQDRLESSDYQAYARGKKVRSAANWIGALAILFAISGLIMFAIQYSQTDVALINLSRFQDGDQLEPINGKSYTAGELRAVVRREPFQILIVNLIVAGLMAGLWVWGKRSPLPAIGCAFALFLVVHVGSAMVDPTSLARGIILKIAAIAALASGLKSALEARAMMRRPSA